MYKTDRLLYAMLVTSILLILTPNLVLAHIAAYNAGSSQGQRDKQNGQLETTIESISRLASNPTAGCGPGTDNSTCPTSPPKPSPSNPTMGKASLFRGN